MTLRNEKISSINSSEGRTTPDIEKELISAFNKFSEATMVDFDEGSMEGKLDLVKQKAQNLQSAKWEKNAQDRAKIKSLDSTRPSRKLRLSLAGAIAATLSLAGIFTFFTTNHSSIQASHSTSTVVAVKAPSAAQVAVLEANASPTCPTGIIGGSSTTPISSCIGKVEFATFVGANATAGSPAGIEFQPEKSARIPLSKLSMKEGETIYILLQQMPGNYEWEVLGTNGANHVISKSSLIDHTGSLLLTIHALSIGNYSIKAGEFWSGAPCKVSTTTSSCPSTTLPMNANPTLMTVDISVSISK